MENSFKTIVDRAKSIIILLPQKPYFDQVAAGLSLYLTLKDIKPARVISTSQMIVEFNRLIGVNKVNNESGSKNLVIRFKNYEASDIEKVNYDIEDGMFKLSVIPKSGVRPPQTDQVDITYSGGGETLAILVGGMNETHFPDLQNKELDQVELVHVGNKKLSLSSNRSCLSFFKPSPSTSEVAYELLVGSGFKVTEDAATNLIMGIEDATGYYSPESVVADTFAIISELMQLGGKRMSRELSAGNFPPGSIPEKGKDTDFAGQDQKNEEHQTGSESLTVSTNQQNDKSTQDKSETPEEWLKTPKVYKGASVN